MKKYGLAALIHPLEMSQFLTHFKNNRPFVIHHEVQELQELRELPFLDSLEVLLDSWTSEVQVHLPDLRDEASAINVQPSEAGIYFDEGMGLLFNDVNRISPILQDWVDQIKNDLGISSQAYGRSLIYATPDGQGTAAHFDQNINFVLQIQGTKKWILADNQSVMNPMDRHTIGLPVDPEMLSYQQEPMPETMPQKAISFDLKPGSLLFVPRGTWHSTEAEGDALALNFTFTAPTWSDLLLGALRSRLILSPDWRETALVANEGKFESLISSLVDDLPNWKARDILEATES
jgi:50S ribosomal protein L16 3-hydroxylase